MKNILYKFFKKISLFFEKKTGKYTYISREDFCKGCQSLNTFHDLIIKNNHRIDVQRCNDCPHQTELPKSGKITTYTSIKVNKK